MENEEEMKHEEINSFEIGKTSNILFENFNGLATACCCFGRCGISPKLASLSVHQSMSTKNQLTTSIPHSQVDIDIAKVLARFVFKIARNLTTFLLSWRRLMDFAAS